MKSIAAEPGMMRGQAHPLAVAGGDCRRSAGPRRHRMGDRQEDQAIGRFAPVRAVQHFQSPAFHEHSLSQSPERVSFDRQAILNELHHD